MTSVRLLQQPALPFDVSPPTPPPRSPVPAAPHAPTPMVTPGAAPVVAPAPVFTSAVPAVTYVRHPRAKRYLLRVRGDGSVRATIPRGGSKREAVRFVESQRRWIVEQQTIAARRRAERGSRPAHELRELRQRARVELPVRLRELALELGLTVAKVSVRNQRRRWGSCSVEGHICLNWRLVTMPDWVRDYVLVHELMHLRRMDHSPAFWKFVAAACPAYQRARQWLREHGQGLSED